MTPGDKKLTVTWAAPASVLTIKSYTVSYTPKGGTAKTKLVDGTETTTTLTGLTNGTEYTLTVKATSAAGDGTASEAVKATPSATGGTTDPTDPADPDDTVNPTGVMATMNATTPTSIDVSWAAPTGAVVAGYQVSWVGDHSRNHPDPTEPDAGHDDGGRRRSGEGHNRRLGR